MLLTRNFDPATMPQSSGIVIILLVTWVALNIPKKCYATVSIPIVKWGTDVETVLDVVKLNSPVVLKDSPAAPWPALSKWNLSFLQSRSDMSTVAGYRRVGNGGILQENVVICPQFIGKNYSEYSAVLPRAGCGGEKILTRYDNIM